MKENMSAIGVNVRKHLKQNEIQIHTKEFIQRRDISNVLSIDVTKNLNQKLHSEDTKIQFIFIKDLNVIGMNATKHSIINFI